MIGDLRATLYDIFGYLIPGAVALAGIRILLWSAVYPNSVIRLDVLEKPVPLGFTLVLAYLLGHLIHSIGNFAGWLEGVDERHVLGMGRDKNMAPSKFRQMLPFSIFSAASSTAHSAADSAVPPVQDGALSPAIVESVNVLLRDRFGLDAEKLSARDKYAFIDEGRTLCSREGERDVYIYREGFYRGMTLAAAILALGLLLRVVFSKSCVVWIQSPSCVGRWEAFLLAIIAGVSVFGFRYRMQRFAKYRVVRAVMLWLSTVGRRQ